MVMGRAYRTSQGAIPAGQPGSDTTIMQGICSGKPVSVLVDSTGRVISVVGTTPSGVPTPLALDITGQVKTVVSNLADLAAYLDTIVAYLDTTNRYDRGGNVIFQDTGNMLVNWQTQVNGAGSAVTTITDGYLLYSNCYQMATGLTDGFYAGIYKFIPRINIGKFGLEFVFALNNNTKYLEFGLCTYTATMQNSWLIRYVHATKKLQYMNAAGVYVDFYDLSIVGTVASPHITKLVIDEVSGKYVSLRVDTATLDLSTLACYSSPSSPVYPSLQVVIRETGDASGGIADVGSVVVTDDE